MHSHSCVRFTRGTKTEDGTLKETFVVKMKIPDVDRIVKGGGAVYEEKVHAK